MKHEKYSYQPLNILVQELRKLCREKKTGMLFIITDDKHASHILLIAGNIIEITFGYEKGKKALALLSKVKTCRFQFSEDHHKKEINTTTLVNSNKEILKELSFNATARKKRFKYKVLIVDDSKVAREIVKNALSSRYIITEASNGLDAMNSLTKDRPDIILLDVAMPKLDGYSTLSLIKKNENYAGIPIFMLTAQDSLLDKVKGKLSQSDEYLTKPFHADVLLNTIENYLPGAHSHMWSAA